MKKYVSRLLAFFTAGALTSAFLPYPSSFVRADEKEAVNEPIELEEYITQTAGKHVTFTNTLERFYPGCDINYIFSLSSDGTLHKYLGNCSETVFMTTDSFDINDLNSELASKEINADIKEVRENEFAINMVSGKNGIIKSYNELLNTLEYSGKVSSIEMKYTFMEDKANSCSGYWFLFDSHVTTEYILDNYSLDLVPLQNEYLEDYPVVEKSQARKQMGLKPDGKYVLFAGAFDNTVKNAPLAKAAVALLPEVELLELKNYSRQQVALLMQAADAFIMTSHTEGSPQTIKEALACGTPIVSIDVGDVRERIKGVDGCYLAERDKEELSVALKKAIAYGKRTQGRTALINSMLTNDAIALRLADIYDQYCLK